MLRTGIIHLTKLHLTILSKVPQQYLFENLFEYLNKKIVLEELKYRYLKELIHIPYNEIKLIKEIETLVSFMYEEMNPPNLKPDIYIFKNNYVVWFKLENDYE